METKIDSLMAGRVKLIQRKKGAKASLDSALLASAIDRRALGRGGTLLDVGVGGGAVALSILVRIKDARAVGIDVQDELLDLAWKSAALNGLGGRIELMKDDILNPSRRLKAMSFDAIATNPPYHEGRAAPDISRAAARSEADLNEWIRHSARRLKSSGTFAIVHKAQRVDDILFAMRGAGLGKIEIFPFYSKAGQEAKRVVVRGVKDSRAPAKIHPPLILHARDGSHTRIARQILEFGEELAAIAESPA